jgi:hypothetical protein
MLFDQSSERYVASALLLDLNRYLPEFRQAGLSSAHFLDDYSKRIWEMLSESYDADFSGEAQDLAERVCLSEHIPDAREFSVGITDIRAKFQGHEWVAQHIKILNDQYAKRLAHSRTEQLNKKIEEGASIDEIGEELAVLGDDFCAASAGASKDRLPDVLSFKQLMQQFPDKPQPIIEGVLGQGDKLILSASSKAGKTWLMLDLAYAVQNGATWLGHSCRKANALYINFELTEQWTAERVRLIVRDRSIEKHPEVLNLRGRQVTWHSLSKHIQNHLKKSQKNYGIIILDPIYKMLGDNDENANGDIGKLLNSLEQMGHENNAAIAFSHHHSKGNKSNVDAIERMSGAGVWGRDPDAIIDMVSHEEENCYTVEAIPRNYIRPPKLVVRSEFPHFILVDGANPDLLRKPGGSRKKLSEADVVIMCKQTPLGIKNSELLKKLANAYSVTEETARIRVKEATKSGTIKKDGKFIKPVTSTEESDLIQSHYPKLENNELGMAG